MTAAALFLFIYQIVFQIQIEQIEFREVLGESQIVQRLFEEFHLIIILGLVDQTFNIDARVFAADL
jgi:hypothetical protein